ncbi:MAG: hypothetical protein ACE5GW_08610 [Planctomycetota bacterium]
MSSPTVRKTRGGSTPRLLAPLEPLLDDAGRERLQEIDGRLSLAVDRRLGAVASAQGKEALHQAIEKEIWGLVQLWGKARAAADAARPLEEIGRWSISEEERILLDCGFLHLGLLRDEGVGEELPKVLARLFDESLLDSPPILPLSGYFAARLRSRLGVDEHLRRIREAEERRQRAAETRCRLEEHREALRAHLAQEKGGNELLEIQARLDQLLPHLARLTDLSRTGGISGREDHRAQVKIFEAAERLRRRILDGIRIYKRRKSYEALQKELVERMVLVARAEEDSDDPRRVEDPPPTPGRFIEEFGAILKEAQDRMARVSGATAGSLPPFTLEHRPRLTPMIVLERWNELLKACPRLKSAQEGEWYESPRVFIFPGIGNPRFDPTQGDVHASLFPIEAKLTSITGALGESYLSRDRELRDSYRRLKRLPAGDDPPLYEAFRREILMWVESDSKGKRTLDRATHRWFEHQMVIRRTRPRK